MLFDGAKMKTRQGTPQAKRAPPASTPHRPARYYLTQCIHELVLESQLPHKPVNLIF